MRPFVLAVYLWCLIAASADAQSIKLPATVKVPEPGLVVVVPDAVDGDAVAWFTIDPGFQLIPNNLLKSDQTAVGVAVKTGTYRLRAVCAKTVNGKAVISQAAECLVQIGADPPPPPPTPTDPFFLTLKATWAQEQGATRMADAALLAQVYRQTALAAADAKLATAGDFWKVFEGAISGTMTKAMLPAVRAALSNELTRVMPSDPAQALDAGLRSLIASNLNRLAVDLEALCCGN